jgi:hypothetical protein
MFGVSFSYELCLSLPKIKSVRVDGAVPVVCTENLNPNVMVMKSAEDCV